MVVRLIKVPGRAILYASILWNGRKLILGDEIKSAPLVRNNWSSLASFL